MDLDILLKHCQAGDELAWEALVRQFQARIYGLAWHYTGNAEDARDLAQEVFIKIYHSLDHCRDAAMFVPWMITIGRNLSIDHLRRRNARPPAQDLPVEAMVNLPDHAASPEEQWLANSRKRLIHSALRQLTALNREIIILKEIQGLALEQIASILKVPLGTIKSRCNRARIELAEKVLEMTNASKNQG